MLQYNFQVYFNFVFYIIIQIQNGISKENETKNVTSLSIQKCGFRCSCDDFRRFPGVICKNMTDHMTYFPMYGNNISNSIYQLKFTDTIHLPARIFQGLHVYQLIVDDLGVTIDKNVFEGTIGLYEFQVERSSIKVIHLSIIKLECNPDLMRPYLMFTSI